MSAYNMKVIGIEIIIVILYSDDVANIVQH